MIWCITLVRQGWRPIGDEAAIAAISAGILDGNYPWLGMRSTGFMDVAGLQMYHPGPVQFYLLAGSQALTSFSTLGLLLASALLFVALVGLGLRGAWLAAGWWGLAPATATFALLALAAQDVMIQLSNPLPTTVALPAMVLTAWAVACGRKNSLSAYVFCATIAAQLHIAALPFAVAVSFVLLMLMWRNRALIPARNSLIRASALFLVLWSGPILDIFFSRPNNPSEFLRYLTSGNATTSIAAATQIFPALLYALIVALALLASRRTHAQPATVPLDLPDSLSAGLRLGAIAVALMAFLTLTATTTARASQAGLAIGIALFLAGLLLSTWRYQKKLRARTENVRQRKNSVIFLGGAIALIPVAGFLVPLPTHAGAQESNPGVVFVSDEVSQAIDDIGLDLPIEIVADSAWHIGLYLAPSLHYSFISEQRDAHFEHPWTFEKDHVRPGITQPRGERLVISLGSSEQFAAQVPSSAKVVWTKNYATEILSPEDVVNVMIFHLGPPGSS